MTGKASAISAAGWIGPVLFVLTLVCVISAEAGETLYNGIVLPDTWPPRIEELTAEPMPVPYLEHPPEVIPIDLGRQLFVDDFLIEQTTLGRTFHTAEYYEGNPVLRPERRWEKAFKPGNAMVFSDGVWYDPQAGLFKMWYRADCGNTCYATSEDGIHWERPALDVQPGTNVVCLAGYRDSSTVWLDLEEKDPNRRYKLFQFHRDCWRASLHSSADGIHWSGPTWCGNSGDRSTIFYNPFRKVWVCGCLVVGNRLFFYVSGRSGPANSTGLAFLRRDGFASMDAKSTEGSLTTRPVRFAGKHLFVNVDAKGGELRVEVLDRDGKVIGPFTRANCNPVGVDKTRQPITWRGADDLSAVAGRPVRFRFLLERGSLYAFWVSSDRIGASHGYVAAGGPGFTDPTDTIGSAK